MAEATYGRAVGSVWAFLIVGLLVKYAELLATVEYQSLLPSERTLAQRAEQMWLSLRFSWQELIIAAGLFALLGLWHWRRPAAGRWTRIALAGARVLLGVLSLLSVIGIAYYSLYNTHFTTDDLRYLVWAPFLLQSAGRLDLLSVQMVGAVWVVVTFGLPWLAQRYRPLTHARTTVSTCLLLGLTALATWGAGRPNLAEARLEPNPVVWMLFGQRVSYANLPPVTTMAPVGASRRAYAVAERPRNIVVVALESTPAFALSAFDPTALAGRRLFAEFGDDVTAFDQIFAVQPSSTASLFSVLTGRSPVPTTAAALAASAATPTLPEILKRRGYQTEFLLNGPTDSLIAALTHRGFDRRLTMHDAWPNRDRYARLTWGFDDRMLFDTARSVIEHRPPSSPPLFLFLHTSNAHHPYTSDAIPGLAGSDDAQLRHRELVRYTLELLTDFYRALKASGLAESTVVLAYGDHGEAFGEHARNFIHSRELYRENLHVPVLLLHPRRLGLPTRISQLGSLDDLTPTLLDLLGIEPDARQGMSLLFEAPDRVLFSMTDWEPGQVALRDRRYLYVLSRTGRELLFDRIADPLERTNLMAERPAVGAAFRARLRE
ncbi:MAG: sulfatase-like hydrolase/transferase [Deltaproteobacteria bacterium]|nr:sulfatase-like hydrolase/transferase [Deltaproteobacteria bacterium]